MLSLGPLQRALDTIYRVGVHHAVDDFVRPMSADDPEAHRREVVLVSDGSEDHGLTEIAVMLDPDVMRVLAGGHVSGLSRFDAWCLALEGVSHFVLLAYRADNDRPVSQLELELQADVDKFVVALIDRALFRSAGEAHLISRKLRRAVFESQQFVDSPDSVRGARYRRAHRLASRYTASLERKYVRDGRISLLIEELRDFYRACFETKCAMAEAA